MHKKENGDMHVVFGAGQVGSYLAEELRDRGIRVRVAKRSPKGIPEGVDQALGDAGDLGFCRKAAEGAAVVYHCMNPPYTVRLWRELLPRFQENLVAAAGGTGARLVVLENLYMVGQGDGDPITEDTPINPRSKKGEIRARLTEDLYAAHRRGAVARGLMILGLAPEEALGKPWMLPCAPAETSRALVNRFSRALDQEIKLRGVPGELDQDSPSGQDYTSTAGFR